MAAPRGNFARDRDRFVDRDRICHDLRQPVAAVQAFGELLADDVSGPLNAEQREHVAAILRNCAALERGIEQVREMLASVDSPLPELSPSCGRRHGSTSATP